jgi:hypothetical protein
VASRATRTLGWLATARVLGAGYGFQVRWIAAGPNTTEVIDLQAVWDIPNEKRVGDSVDVLQSILDTQLPVSTVVGCPRPNPAVSLPVDSTE